MRINNSLLLFSPHYLFINCINSFVIFFDYIIISEFSSLCIRLRTKNLYSVNFLIMMYTITYCEFIP